MLFFSADQTPTPTKFLRNCEEIGLFHELSKNPFEEAFKKAADETKNLDMPEVKFKTYRFMNSLLLMPDVANRVGETFME